VNETVLVVDDEERIRSSLRGILGDEGFRVLDTGDAPNALEIIRRENPELVLLDVWMPALDGIELRDIRLVYEHASAIERHEPVDGSQQRGLAAARRAEQHHEFSAAQR